MTHPAPTIVTLDPAAFGRRLDRLAEILQACVRARVEKASSAGQFSERRRSA
jgi:hypothetical protein